MVARTNLGISRPLTAFTQLLATQPSQFIADKALPVAPVRNKKGRYYSVAGGFGFSSPGHGIVRLSGAKFPRRNFSISQVEMYELKEVGVEGSVDDVDRDAANEDDLDLLEGATRLAWLDTMYERERDLAGLLFNTGTFAGFTAALGGAAQWDAATSDPRDEADAAETSIRRTVGVPLEECSLILGAEPWQKLSRNEALLDFYKFTMPGATYLGRQLVAQAMGIKEILVGNAVANSAVEGQAATNADIWGKFALFAYLVPNPQPLAPHGIGATFQASTRPQGQVERYREEPRTEVVLPTWYEDRVVTTPGAGYLFSTVIA